MPNLPCSYPECTYETGEIADKDILLELLKIHGASHIAVPTAPPPPATKQKAPKIERPKISYGSSEETWNTIIAHWSMFKRGTQLTPDETMQQLFQCCDDDLGNAILRSQPDVVK